MTLNKTNTLQNNEAATDLIRYLKKNKEKYRNLNKRQERELIESLRNKDDAKLRELLVLHNIRIVFNIAKKYAKRTRDFDNMVSKGLYGLVQAANRFDYDMVVKRKVQETVEDAEGNRKMVERDEIQYEDDGTTPRKIKFITFARSWVFRYVVEEFYHKSVKIDANSLSLDQTPRIKNNDAEGMQEEQTILNKIAPEVERDDFNTQLSAATYSEYFTKAMDYVNRSEKLTNYDKIFFKELFCDQERPTDVARRHGVNLQFVVNSRRRTLNCVKKLFNERYNVKSMDDLEVK